MHFESLKQTRNLADGNLFSGLMVKDTIAYCSLVMVAEMGIRDMSHKTRDPFLADSKKIPNI